MKSSSRKPPLHLNIFWHNSSKEAKAHAELLYGNFRRNPHSPHERYIGIPCFLYPYAPSEEELRRAQSELVVNLVFIDNHMVISPEWKEFLIELEKRAREPNFYFVPIALTKNAFKISDQLNARNFLRIWDAEDQEPGPFLLINLTHNIGRILYGKKMARHDEDNSLPYAPLNLFLSHAGKDGKTLVKALRERIGHYIGLDAFLDTKDIDAGHRFDDQIEHAIKDSIMVVHNTDEFSSSVWGMREVILAKENFRPVVVVNRYKKGTNRGSPFVGNVPHLHLDEEDEETILLDYILVGALREAVRAQYVKKQLDYITHSFGLKEKKLLAYPPSLDTIAHLGNLQKNTDTPLMLVYPDPPLSLYEHNYLKARLKGNFIFTTPALLPLTSSGAEQALKGLKISFSLSETDMGAYTWITNRYIEDMMVELVRYLLVSGSSLIYSGNIDYQQKVGGEVKNFAELLMELVTINRKNLSDHIKGEIPPMENFSFYPLYPLKSTNDLADLKDIVKFQPVAPPENLKLTEDKASTILKFQTFPDKYVWAKCLTKMREEMFEATDAHISLGGKWLNFKGKMPGVLEEIQLVLKKRKPLYLIGGFGGVTGGVVDLIRGKEVNNFSLAFFEHEYPDYCRFLQAFNDSQLTQADEKVDYSSLRQFFAEKFPEEGPDKYAALNNGLSDEENETLFTSRNEMEVITILLKGLKTIKNNGSS